MNRPDQSVRRIVSAVLATLLEGVGAMVAEMMKSWAYPPQFVRKPGLEGRVEITHRFSSEAGSN